jgi:hypothetical protein
MTGHYTKGNPNHGMEDTYEPKRYFMSFPRNDTPKQNQ